MSAERRPRTLLHSGDGGREPAGGAERRADPAGRARGAVDRRRLGPRRADFSGSGSGFLVDDDGHIVTNAHVIDGFTPPLDVVGHGGVRLKADIVGTDRISDIALLVLRDPPARLPALPLRTSPAQLGELCFGLGSPLGVYPESVSIGVVSGLGRTIRRKGLRPVYQAVQTDVAISPGNSGGPLVDARGEVLGVNQCIDARGAGIGFAIPAATVRAVAAELKANGSVARAALGVTVVRRTVAIDGRLQPGLAVTRIGDVDAAGDLAVGDVIIGLAETPVTDAGDLFALLTVDRIGQPTDLTVVRDGQRATVVARPARLPD